MTDETTSLRRMSSALAMSVATRSQAEWSEWARAKDAECERLRIALTFYADSANYEWHAPTSAEAPDWTDEDRENAESTSVLLDAGHRARKALS